MHGNTGDGLLHRTRAMRTRSCVGSLQRIPAYGSGRRCVNTCYVAVLYLHWVSFPRRCGLLFAGSGCMTGSEQGQREEHANKYTLVPLAADTCIGGGAVQCLLWQSSACMGLRSVFTCPSVRVGKDNGRAETVDFGQSAGQSVATLGVCHTRTSLKAPGLVLLVLQLALPGSPPIARWVTKPCNARCCI